MNEDRLAKLIAESPKLAEKTATAIAVAADLSAKLVSDYQNISTAASRRTCSSLQINRRKTSVRGGSGTPISGSHA